MLSINDYLKNPCRMSSIPFWKQKTLIVPHNMRIVHNYDYVESKFTNYIDEPYFRLYHDLKNIKQLNTYSVEIVVATPDMIDVFVEIINESYNDLSVTKKQMESYCKTTVYCPDLWLLLKDKTTGIFVGCGIADYDNETKEMIIEWVQILPKFRRLGYGQLIVNSMLSRMENVAEFATVSGKINNLTQPEKLYRKCGFTGNDIWHILTEIE